jgi:hypothetical protein
MKLYFDTNIYNFIAACGESHAVRRFLDSSGHKVQASSENLFEIYAIPEASARGTELSTLVTVASSFEPQPQSWLHAYEVRREIGRCRPHWVKKVPFTKQARQFLKGHRQSWEEAKTLQRPREWAYAVYRRDAEGAVHIDRELQKAMRERQLTRKNTLRLVALNNHTETEIVSDAELRDPEIFWRAACMVVWYNALVVRAPGSRDYTDWLAPYVKEEAFQGSTYTQFWLQDVKAECVPRNRLLGLVNYYQTSHKITHGNATDQLHASHLLDSDLFFTADRAYHTVLLEVLNRHFPSVALPILLNRSAQSALGELSSALSTA